LLRGLVEDVGSSGLGAVIDSRLQAYSIVATGTHVASWYRVDGSMSLDEVVTTYTRVILRQLSVPEAVWASDQRPASVG
jgi:hypothetical protein